MKKKSLKNLQLGKKSISNLEKLSTTGGFDSQACRIESVIICPGPDTDGCGSNPTFATFCECGTR
ncbi:MAG: hypothetical protein AAF617_08935 [Bacteroidota bacterium]